MKHEDCRKPYEAPKAEVICFSNEDVITASKKDTRLPVISGSSWSNLSNLF